MVSATVDAEGVDPEAFLRSAEGRPRGFWARGERWVAHEGILAELSAEPGPGRFAEIMRQAADLPRPSESGTRVRLYGGFAFAAGHVAEGPWTGFPTALFHLPEVELRGDASGRVRLRVSALRPGEDSDDAVTRLEERARARVRELREGTAGPIGERPDPTRARSTALRRNLWEEAVREILEAIDSGAVSKVVLARTLDIRSDRPVGSVDVVAGLRSGNPGTHVFLFEPRPGHALLGAAPEAVATLRQGVFHATAVAGSVARGGTPDEQERLARQLLASAKDRAEQAIVVEDMVSRLGPLARDIRAEPEPRVLTLARIQHLETEIRARVEVGVSILHLVEALHPTPAVCGVPREAALEILSRDEPFHRGWYAGPVGWFTLDGDGHFVPALRTAVGSGSEWRLFAGAGIVDGSEPAAEWEETAIKFQPVLRALAAAGVELPDDAS